MLLCKLNYCIFTVASSNEKVYNLSLAFAKLLTFYDFLFDQENADDIYFVFMKKHLSDFQNHKQLGKTTW